jgi:hypothetical protein
MSPTTTPHPVESHTAAPARELDSRITDGLHVQLLWHPLDGHVSVAVSDSKTGDAFELGVRRGQRALDMFHHPYAYAAETRHDEPLTAQTAH